LKLSSRGDYAVRALIELANLNSEQTLALPELASRTAIPPRYLEQILRQLTTANIIMSRRGAQGGYRLRRPAEEVTVGEVIRVMDGPLAPTACASRTQHQPCPAYRCADEETCTLREMWVSVRDAISAIVDQTTFRDLADRRKTVGSLHYAI
jgi:Rrf2 family protein